LVFAATGWEKISEVSILGAEILVCGGLEDTVNKSVSTLGWMIFAGSENISISGISILGAEVFVCEGLEDTVDKSV